MFATFRLNFVAVEFCRKGFFPNHSEADYSAFKQEREGKGGKADNTFKSKKDERSRPY